MRRAGRGTWRDQRGRRGLIPAALLALSVAACASDGSGGPADAASDGDTRPDVIQPGPDLVRVGTWNVHLFFDDVCDSGHCGGSNFEYAPTTAEFEGRAQQIALAIERLEVDVIMLEEVENQRALDAIVSYLPDDWVTEVLGETGFDASIDVAVLARIPLSEVRTHRSETPLVLPNGDTTTFARELLEVRLQNGMIVFAAHFRSKVNDEPERRLAEARAARAIVLDVAAEEPGATVVLGGDLNDVPDSPPLDALTSGDDGLVRLAAELFPGADWTIRFESEHLAIDHLLVPHGASLAAFVPRTVGVARENSNGGYGGSDHGAVRAIFRPDPAVTFPAEDRAMIVIYEVNLSVDRAIADAYAAWLADHIREMLKIPGFFRARWYERRPEDEGRDPAEVALWTVSYDVYSRDDLDRYFREDAPRMREDGVARFGGRFEASRRILEPRSLGGEPLGLDT